MVASIGIIAPISWFNNRSIIIMIMKHQEELLQVVSSDERAIVETFMDLKNGGKVDFSLMSETLFAWSKKWISSWINLELEV